MNRAYLLAALFASLPLTSCNIFDPFDSPSDDEQFRSAARACVDKGDFACARDHYSKLTSQTDRDKAEQAYMALDEAGMGFSNFLTAFGGGGNSAGVVLTRLANILSPRATEQNRIAIFNAYKLTASMAEGEEKGLLKFVAAISLAAHILAEEADVQGKLKKLDLADDPTGCQVLTCPPGCAASGTRKISNGGGAFPADLDLATSISGPLFVKMLISTFKSLESGLRLMGLSTGSNNALFAFTEQLAVFGAAGDDCVRQYLIKQNIGE